MMGVDRTTMATAAQRPDRWQVGVALLPMGLAACSPTPVAKEDCETLLARRDEEVRKAAEAFLPTYKKGQPLQKSLQQLREANEKPVSLQDLSDSEDFVAQLNVIQARYVAAAKDCAREGL